LSGGCMTGSSDWFEVTTIGSRGWARAMPSALAPGGVQLEFRFSTGWELTVTFTSFEAGELMRQMGATFEVEGAA
jgi:hypothetical protein